MVRKEAPVEWDAIFRLVWDRRKHGVDIDEMRKEDERQLNHTHCLKVHISMLPPREARPMMKYPGVVASQ